MRSYEWLRAAIDVLERYGWCQGAVARDAAGNSVNVLSPDRRLNPAAVAYSAYGAIMRAGMEARTPPAEPPLMWDMLRHQAEVRGVRGSWEHGHPIHMINDQPGQTKQWIIDYLAAAADDCEASIQSLDQAISAKMAKNGGNS